MVSPTTVVISLVISIISNHQTIRPENSKLGSNWVCSGLRVAKGNLDFGCFADLLTPCLQLKVRTLQPAKIYLQLFVNDIEERYSDAFCYCQPECVAAILFSSKLNKYFIPLTPTLYSSFKMTFRKEKYHTPLRFHQLLQER